MIEISVARTECVRQLVSRAVIAIEAAAFDEDDPVAGAAVAGVAGVDVDDFGVRLVVPRPIELRGLSDLVMVMMMTFVGFSGGSERECGQTGRSEEEQFGDFHDVLVCGHHEWVAVPRFNGKCLSKNKKLWALVGPPWGRGIHPAKAETLVPLGGDGNFFARSAVDSKGMGRIGRMGRWGLAGHIRWVSGDDRCAQDAFCFGLLGFTRRTA